MQCKIKKIKIDNYITLVINVYNYLYFYYHISYQKIGRLSKKCDVIVKFNGNNIGLLYGNKVLSLDDIFDIKYIIENNFRTAISYDSRFYFKTYNDAKNFLKEIKKQSDIFGI